MGPELNLVFKRPFIRAVLISTLIYGAMNLLFNQFLLPTAPVIAIRPQISIPMLIGIIYGPGPGFLVGCLGNLLGDSLCGYGPLTFLNWHVGNGVMGFVPGMIHYLGIHRISTVRDFGTAQLSLVIASALGVGFAVLGDLLWVKMMVFPESLNGWIWPAFLTDAVNGFIIVPLLLIAWRFMFITLETRTMLAVTYLLVLAVLGTAFAVTWALYSDQIGDLTSKDAMVRAVYFSGIVSVIILVIGFLVSVFLAKRVTEPVIKISKATEKVENGNYSLNELNDVSSRSDELGQLSRVIQSMASEVKERENRLKRQVSELQIEIDQNAKSREVEEIVESDYFKTLKAKVRSFRDE